jgi:hypothetical protein
MNYRIVVARHKENVEWTKQFKNIIIYNKGNHIGGGYNEIFLNNVGREGHTYYHHIYNNYDNLEDYTVFLQGNPFDHSPFLLKNLNNYINLIDKGELTTSFEVLSEYMGKCNLNNCDHKGIPLFDVYSALFDVKKTDLEIEFGAGAQFIVSKKSILKKPKEFYLNIVKMLEYSINPIEGFCVERLHKLIFE